ncbi:sulfite exporter TauE/SafE family protein [Enterococcus casseliflavus]|uniref:sulfite exporter TauE/SafE family protein n=1 Tax=Enterococcus casseliflavus TaxID=37734 RepID=UPI0020BF7CF8|nr:sulfite exporter TauE/SafE family protein [Enterococcus casseliflavus]
MTLEFIFVLVALMQVIGFFVQGCTGFGCTIIAAVTNGLLGTEAGVPYGTLITLPFLYFLGIKAFREVSWKDLVRIVVLCLPGIFLGNYLFQAISPDIAKISIGAMVTLIALMNIYKSIVKPKLFGVNDINNEQDSTAKKIFRYSCLILGGIVHGAFNIGGPLITVYTIEAVQEKEKFRNTMNMVWVVLNT